MAAGQVGRILSIFENNPGAISIQTLARELKVSPSRVEGLLDFWVKKGKIRASSSLTECGSCGKNGNCSFILDLPRTYELVGDQESLVDPSIHQICTR